MLGASRATDVYAMARRPMRVDAAARGSCSATCTRCESREGGGCSCQPGFQAQVWSPRDGKTIRKTFRSLSDARAWRAEAQTAAAPAERSAHQPERRSPKPRKNGRQPRATASSGPARRPPTNPPRCAATSNHSEPTSSPSSAIRDSQPFSRSRDPRLIDRMLATGRGRQHHPQRRCYRYGRSTAARSAATDVLVNPTERARTSSHQNIPATRVARGRRGSRN